MHELIEHADHINELLARYGVKFGIYKNNQFKEQLFPFDAIPRVIAHEEFERLEKGLTARAGAEPISKGYLRQKADRKGRRDTGRIYLYLQRLSDGMRGRSAAERHLFAYLRHRSGKGQK